MEEEESGKWPGMLYVYKNWEIILRSFTSQSFCGKIKISRTKYEEEIPKNTKDTKVKHKMKLRKTDAAGCILLQYIHLYAYMYT